MHFWVVVMFRRPVVTNFLVYMYYAQPDLGKNKKISDTLPSNLSFTQLYAVYSIIISL